MIIVKVGTKLPAASYFKPAEFSYGFLKATCGRSYMLVDAEHRATPFASVEDANAAVARYGFAYATLIESKAVKPIPKKSGFFS